MKNGIISFLFMGKIYGSFIWFDSSLIFAESIFYKYAIYYQCKGNI